MWETQLRKMLSDQAETINSNSKVANEVIRKIENRSNRRVIWRKKVIVGIMSCAVLIFTGGVYADQLYNYWKVPTTPEEVKKSEELHNELNAQRKSIDETIADTFELSLTRYKAIDVNDLFKSEEIDPLLLIVSDIMDKQELNDRKPSVYINNENEGEGYIFEDKVEKYVVHFIKRDKEGNWQIVSSQAKTKKE